MGIVLAYMLLISKIIFINNITTDYALQSNYLLVHDINSNDAYIVRNLDFLNYCFETISGPTNNNEYRDTVRAILLKNIKLDLHKYSGFKNVFKKYIRNIKIENDAKLGIKYFINKYFKNSPDPRRKIIKDKHSIEDKTVIIAILYCMNIRSFHDCETGFLLCEYKE
jgi:hypothetical protein